VTDVIAQTNYDARVGANIAELRRSRDLTQSQLADEVNEADPDLAFRQQTIVKIEKGQRPVRLQEAQALARALGVDTEVLTESEEGFASTSMLVGAITQLERRYDALEDLATKTARSMDWLHATLGDCARVGLLEAQPALLETAENLLRRVPAEIVRDAVDTELKARAEEFGVAGTIVRALADVNETSHRWRRRRV
jgi:transcriptional regulator with XRE-family HTH domain